MAERVEPDRGDDVDGAAGASPQPRRPRLPFWASLLLNVVVALAVVAVVQALWVKVYSVPSGSMENTLEVGDRMLVNRTAYPDGMADSQDVVVFTANEDWATPASSEGAVENACLLYTSPSPRDVEESRMPSSA